MALPSLPLSLNESIGNTEKQSGIRASCVEIDTVGYQEWPEYFQFPPRVGDLVKSREGVMAKISAVVHISGAAGPITLLEITRNTGGSTPVEGSGGALT